MSAGDGQKPRDLQSSPSEGDGGDPGVAAEEAVATEQADGAEEAPAVEEADGASGEEAPVGAQRWPSSQQIRSSRVGQYVHAYVHDQRMREEMLLQVEGLSWDEFCTLNSLSFREFEEVVQGAIFDAGEKVKFWERFDEYSRAGRRVLADVSVKRREWLRRILLRDLGYGQYRVLNQLPDGRFMDSLQRLLESMEERGSQRLEPGSIDDLVKDV